MRIRRIAMMALTSVTWVLGASAGEVCTDAWEYKIIHTEEVADKLTIRSEKMVDAATALKRVLNRLGKRGWEVASENKLIVHGGYNDILKKNEGIASFEPASVLFKRRTTTCVEGEG